jgi:predicted GNAT family N-acyltransferase
MTSEITFRSIPFGSADYDQECRLRNEVLRRPLGLDLFAEDLAAEREQQHFGLFDASGRIVACVIAVPQSPTKAKIRQMAVDPSRQRQGLGQRLLRAVEEQLCEAGVERTSLHARVEAVPFYRSLGYAVVGEEFIEVGIPHLAMEKTIRGDGAASME